MSLKKLRSDMDELKRIVQRPVWSFKRLLENNSKYRYYEKFYRESLNLIQEEAVENDQVNVVEAVKAVKDNDNYW